MMCRIDSFFVQLFVFCRLYSFFSMSLSIILTVPLNCQLVSWINKHPAFFSSMEKKSFKGQKSTGVLLSNKISRLNLTVCAFNCCTLTFDVHLNTWLNFLFATRPLCYSKNYLLLYSHILPDQVVAIST